AGMSRIRIVCRVIDAAPDHLTERAAFDLPGPNPAARGAAAALDALEASCAGRKGCPPEMQQLLPRPRRSWRPTTSGRSCPATRGDRRTNRPVLITHPLGQAPARASPISPLHLRGVWARHWA